MMICVVSGSGSCPPDAQDWSFVTFLIVLVLAITAYKAWKVYLKRRYPLEGDIDD